MISIKVLWNNNLIGAGEEFQKEKEAVDNKKP